MLKLSFLYTWFAMESARAFKHVLFNQNICFNVKWLSSWMVFAGSYWDIHNASGSIKPKTNFYAKPFSPWKTGKFLFCHGIAGYSWQVLHLSNILCFDFLLYETWIIFIHLAKFLRHFWRNSCCVTMSVDHVSHYFEADK